jgi:DNA-binding SARP family transcriptional activator/streptogramin lyase
MRYLILGPLEVRDGETDVALRGGQQRKLLAILLLHSGEAVSSDRLIEELWDGKPPETAAKALQGYVSSLRKQLGPETVDTVGASYRFEVAPGDLDAHRFEELLAEARPLERAAAAAKLREALALWRGPALADFAYDDFARHEIDRLDELRLVATERRIDLELALGHHDDLVPELEALVRAYPLRERLRGHLMVALYRSGRQAEALDAYRDARTALRDELGLEPSEELQALQRAILAHDPSLAAPPRVDPPVQADADGQPQRRRFRRPLLAVVLGLAILGGAIAAALLTRGHAAPIVVPPDNVARIDPARTKIQNYVSVGSDPRAIAVGLGSVWVANAADGTVDRLDPATGAFRGHPIGIGGDDLSGIAIGSGSVWVADGNDGTVTRIDPNLNQVAATIPHDPKQTVAPAPVFFIAYGSHYVWATRANELLRIDPNTNGVKRLEIGTPTGLATGGGSVWVTTSAGLLRIDPATVKRISLRSFDFARAPVYWRGSVWLIADDEIQRIDPITLEQRDVESTGSRSQPASLAAGDGALWVVDFLNGKLTRLAPGSGRTASVRVGKNLPRARLPSSNNLSAVAVGGGATWVAVSAGH